MVDFGLERGGDLALFFILNRFLMDLKVKLLDFDIELLDEFFVLLDLGLVLQMHVVFLDLEGLKGFLLGFFGILSLIVDGFGRLEKGFLDVVLQSLNLLFFGEELLL